MTTETTMDDPNDKAPSGTPTTESPEFPPPGETPEERAKRLGDRGDVGVVGDEGIV